MRALTKEQLALRMGDGAAGSLALVYSAGSLGDPKVYQTAEAAPTIMQACLDHALAQGELVDPSSAAVRALLHTTARRVLLARFPRARTPLSRTRFLVMHAEEPADELSAKLLARFALALAAHNEDSGEADDFDMIGRACTGGPDPCPLAPPEAAFAMMV